MKAADESMPARIRRFLVMALAAVGLLVLTITFTPLVFWYATWLSGPWNYPKGDILIVLSASAGADGLMERDSYLRATYGVLMWRQGHFRKIVVCGREAGLQMRNFMIFSGVPAEAVVVEQESASTHESALFTEAMLRGEPGRKMLLTSDYHMYRASACFRRAGLDIQPLPVPDVRKYYNHMAFRWPIAVDLLEETVKIIYYRWEDWI